MTGLLWQIFGALWQPTLSLIAVAGSLAWFRWRIKRDLMAERIRFFRDVKAVSSGPDRGERQEEKEAKLCVMHKLNSLTIDIQWLTILVRHGNTTLSAIATSTGGRNPFPRGLETPPLSPASADSRTDAATQPGESRGGFVNLADLQDSTRNGGA